MREKYESLSLTVLKDLAKTRGIKGVQDYMMREVHKVYKKNSVDVNDKHMEIIIRQMLRKVRIEEAGDTEFLSGDLVDIFRYEEDEEMNPMLGAIETDEEFAKASAVLDELLEELYAEEE